MFPAFFREELIKLNQAIRQMVVTIAITSTEIDDEFALPGCFLGLGIGQQLKAHRIAEAQPSADFALSFEYIRVIIMADVMTTPIFPRYLIVTADTVIAEYHALRFVAIIVITVLVS